MARGRGAGPGQPRGARGGIAPPSEHGAGAALLHHGGAAACVHPEARDGPQEAALRRRAERGGAAEWLVLGTFLQRIERPVSARRAYDRALELAPESLEARTAVAVVRFDKDDPADAFSRLGPLARSNPRSSLVRFHLGVLLLWIQAVDEATKQLKLATQGNGQFYALQAEELLSRLSQN